jgi:hypothetical protein
MLPCLADLDPFKFEAIEREMERREARRRAREAAAAAVPTATTDSKATPIGIANDLEGAAAELRRVAAELRRIDADAELPGPPRG